MVEDRVDATDPDLPGSESSSMATKPIGPGSDDATDKGGATTLKTDGTPTDTTDKGDETPPRSRSPAELN